MGVFGYSVLMVICGSLVTSLRVPLGKDFVQEEAQVTVHHVEEQNLQRKRRDVSHFPEYTNVTISTRVKGDVTLTLQISWDIDVNLPVYEMNDGSIQLRPLEPIKNTAVYKDPANGASILVERVEHETNSHNFSLFGTFLCQGEFYVIQPHEVNGHVVSRVPEHTSVYEMEPLKGRRLHSTARRNGTRTGGRRKRQTNSHLVEVFLVTDYELYTFWYGMTTGANRDTKTLQSMRQYMAYLLNEMDMRYRNIGRSDYSIGILGAGLFIADTASQASWSEDSKFWSSPKYRLSSSSTLDTFQEWVNQQDFPQNDHVMGVTGYDLVSGQSGDGSGIAYTSSLCTTSSVSLIEDRLTFIAMTTATHELGHSLGAVHDGDDNACDSADNYVMAVTNRVTDDPVTGPRLWIFSDCSKNAFKTFIDMLNGINDNCMLTEGSNSAPPTVDAPMAQLYSPDDTCVYAQGTGSYVCRSIQDYSTLCISMYCNDPGTTQCYTILPAEGTPCGNGKWCQNGQCVVSNDAPSDVTDGCPIGDQPYQIDGFGQTCSEIIASNAGNCYNSYINKTCCQSCQAVYTGVTGCEYGDRNVNQCAQMSRFGCYNNEDFCCTKCAAVKNEQIPGCEYGDKLSGCLSGQCSILSQSSREGCCETCYNGTTTAASSTTTTTTTTTTITTPTRTKTTTPTTTTTTTTTSTTPTTASKVSSTSTFVTMTTTEGSKGTIETTLSTMTPIAPTQASTPSTTEVSEMVIIGAGIGGGVILLVMIIVIVCVVRRRRRPRKEKSSSNGTYDNIGFVNSAPSRPPPRRTPDINITMTQPPTKPSAPIKPMFTPKSTPKSTPTLKPKPVLAPKSSPRLMPKLNATPRSTPRSTPKPTPKSDIDGYMMPASPEVKTISDGVMYTAPDKSAIRHAHHLDILNDDQQKRTSKTIHYRRPNGTLPQEGMSPTTSPTESDGRPIMDVYDSIGNVDDDGRTGNGHIPTMYHKPYNVNNPELPNRPSSAASQDRYKPVLPPNRPTKPMVPPKIDDRSNVKREQNTHHFDNNPAKVQKAIDGNRYPLSPPKPNPRNHKESSSGTPETHYDGYYTADSVDPVRPSPPIKPVPRRKRKGSLDGVLGTGKVGYESDNIEIQI